MTTPLREHATAWPAAVTDAARPLRSGVVSRVVGLGVEVRGVPGAVGDLITLGHDGSGGGVAAEVVAAERGVLRCMPLSATEGLRVGDAAVATAGRLRVATGRGLLGRVIDGLGRPMDGGGALVGPRVTSTTSRPRRCIAPASANRWRRGCGPSTR